MKKNSKNDEHIIDTKKVSSAGNIKNGVIFRSEKCWAPKIGIPDCKKKIFPKTLAN